MKRFFLIAFIILGIITINGKVQGSVSLNKSDGNGISSKAFFSKQVGDLFTMDIKDVALEEVLQEISRKNGITFSLPPSLAEITFSLPPSLAEEKVMVKFSNLKLDEGLGKILHRRYNNIFIYMEQTNPSSQSSTTRLTKVKIYPRSNKYKKEVYLTILPEGSTRMMKDKVKEVDKTTKVERLEEERKKLIEDLSLDLRDKNRGVRMEAIKALSKIDDERVFLPLSLALKDKDPGVKREAEKALKEKTDSLKWWNDEREEPESDVELNNIVPVKGVQFTLDGAQPTEIRTTSRTKGFFAQFNKDNGKVILVSLSGNTIAPGTGPIAEIVCNNNDSVSLSGIKIVE
ncbi:MAG: HEAT repeat domain-containing protein [Deltaproteobacteria bacterium]|nr:HEAT repeat domain-containing protein [Deltaproteobacteria bacterium]